MTTPIIAFFLSETFIKTILAHAALLQCLAYVAKKLIKKPATCAGFLLVFLLKRVYDACAGTGSRHGYLAHWQRSSPDGRYRYLHPLLEVSHILMLQ